MAFIHLNYFSNELKNQYRYQHHNPDSHIG